VRYPAEVSYRGELKKYPSLRPAPASLPKAAALTDLLTRSSFGRVSIIFLQGDPADAVFYIQKGKVQITVVSRQGKQGIVAVGGPGEFFGEGSLAGQPFYISTSSAVTRAKS